MKQLRVRSAGSMRNGCDARRTIQMTSVRCNASRMEPHFGVTHTWFVWRRSADVSTLRSVAVLDGTDEF